MEPQHVLEVDTDDAEYQGKLIDPLIVSHVFLIWCLIYSSQQPKGTYVLRW